MLQIYNVRGRKISTLVNEHQAPGSYQVVWNGMNELGQYVAAGMYIYKMIAVDTDGEVFTVAGKLMFLK